MHLLTLNAAGKSLAPPRTLDPRRRRLSQVVGRHVDKSRPHMIAIQRARDPLQPIDEAWVTRGLDKLGKVKPWPRRYLSADAVVVVVYLPRGGSSSSSGSRSKSPLSIALGIAGLALVAFAAPLAGFLLPSLAFGATATFALQAGLVIGGTALLSLASRSKANKPVTDTTQIYGVSGGGNLPKPGDRIPRGYGRSWMKPDLSQPDFSQYAGDDQILLKRHTLGVGKYHPYQVRAGKQVIWQEGTGFVAPFNDPRNAIEFIYGTASTLVPSNVISASGVGGLLPRPEDNSSYAGPYLINQRGALVSRLQVDFQYPQGISGTTTSKSGESVSNRKTGYACQFEYAPIDETGAIIGPWQSAAPLIDISTVSGTRFATHPLRYTGILDVPAGRYAMRGANLLPDTSQHTGAGITNIDAVQWDGASGWVADTAIRPGVTEMALRIYSTKATGAAAFGEIEIDAAAIIPVWTGSQWIEQETSKSVWAYLDIMRNQDYGGAISDDQLDLGTALYYAGALTEFDTFDATIRGPVSVYEAAASALLPMRAEPVHLGRFWSLVRDEPKSVRRHVITRRQMLKGSSQISFDLDTEAGAGHVIGEFDQDGDYRNPNQTTAIYGEASLTPSRQRWTGVKSYAHAQHLTRWRASSGAYRRQTTPFGVEMEGRIYKRGDSISVDVWFIDQVRAVAGVVDNVGDTLILDSDAVLAAGDMATLRDRAGREWGPLTVSQGASAREIVLHASERQTIEAQTGLTLAQVLSDGRRDMTAIRIGQPAALQENYLIQSAKMDGVYKANIEALIDDPRVWTAIGAATGNPPPGYGGILEPESPSLLGLTANIVPVAAGFRLDYAIQPGRGARTFEIGLSYDDGNRFDSRADADMTGSIDLNPVDPTTLVPRARAFGSTGLPGVFSYAPAALPAASVNVALAPITYDDLDTIVKGQIDRIDGVVKEAQGAVDEAFKAVPQLFDLLQRQHGALTQQVAQTVNNVTANAEEQGRAFSQVTTGLVAAVADNTALVLQTAKTVADSTSATATLVTALTARVGANEASVSSVITAYTAADSAISSRLDSYVVRLGTAEGSIASETSARISADGVLTTQYNGLLSRVGNVEAGVSNEATARASGDAANASNITTLFAQSSAGTAAGRFGMTVASAPSGVSVRLAAVASTTTGGAQRNAGWYLDLMPDGTSRFVVDANYFLLTANGGLSYPFSFDGQTLKVPNLVLTSGQASTPLRIDIGSYTLISGAGTANDAIDPNLNFNFTVSNPDFPSLIYLFGKLTVSGTLGGAYPTISGLRLMIDGNLAAYCMFNGQNSAFSGPGQANFSGNSALYLSAGTHNVRIQFSYVSTSNPNGKVQIDELHIAGFTPRA